MAATYQLLHAGYARDDGVGSSASLVRDGDASNRLAVPVGTVEVYTYALR